MKKVCCKNCKYWVRETEYQGRCSKTRISVNGDDVNEFGKKINGLHDNDHGIELVCQDIDNLRDYDHAFMDRSDILERIDVWTGEKFCCNLFENEED